MAILVERGIESQTGYTHAMAILLYLLSAVLHDKLVILMLWLYLLSAVLHDKLVIHMLLLYLLSAVLHHKLVILILLLYMLRAVLHHKLIILMYGYTCCAQYSIMNCYTLARFAMVWDRKRLAQCLFTLFPDVTPLRCNNNKKAQHRSWHTAKCNML